jgi:two-component system sensor kinase FixL
MRLLVLTLVSICIAEALIMAVISHFPSLPSYKETVIDSTLLLLVIIPILYFFLFRPMKSYIERQHSLEKMIFDIEEREQKRIGKRLHDSLGQILTGVAFQAKVMERKLEKTMPGEAAYLAEITSHINDAANEARLLAQDLRSIGTEGESLRGALSDLSSHTEAKYKLRCSTLCDKEVFLKDKTAVTHLYRIAQEAITNAVHHGNPVNIEISLSGNRDGVVMEIRDDGSGFQNTGRYNGRGIEIMHYRARSIGASLDIKSKPAGTVVTCILPGKM